MKHSTGNALISSNHPGTFAIYSFASNALVILSDGHTCDGTFNVDMWTTWASRALNHVVSFSKRGGGSNLRLLVSQQHSHIYHQKQTRPRIQPQSPHRFYTSKYIDRHHQQSFPNMSDIYRQFLFTSWCSVLKKKKLNFAHCLWSLFVIYAIIHVEHVELDKAQQRPLLFMATTLSDNITFMLTLTPKAKQNIRK